MDKIGITGGIGSGKSILSRVLERLGYPVYVSDDRAKDLMVTDKYIITSLKNVLGDDAYIDGLLNKERIASFLFASSANAQIINDIVHPRVRVDFELWCNKHSDKAFVGLESAILFEAKFANEVDKTVLVYAPEEVRMRRAMQRDNASEELIKKKIRAQLSDEWKRERVDFVIDNGGTKAILPQVFQLIDTILKSK